MPLSKRLLTQRKGTDRHRKETSTAQDQIKTEDCIVNETVPDLDPATELQEVQY